nr:MAG TPA: hypothetical protein [Caudoviricetes sp.]
MLIESLFESATWENRISGFESTNSLRGVLIFKSL